MCLGKIRKLYIHIPPTPLPKFSAFVFLACLSEVVWFEGRDWVFAPPKSLFSENSACISISEICSSFLGAKLTSSDDFDRPYECLSVRPYVFPSVRVVTISSLTADRSEEYFLITCRKHCHMFLTYLSCLSSFFLCFKSISLPIAILKNNQKTRVSSSKETQVSQH